MCVTHFFFKVRKSVYQFFYTISSHHQHHHHAMYLCCVITWSGCILLHHQTTCFIFMCENLFICILIRILSLSFFFFLCLHVFQKRGFVRSTIKISVYYRLAAIIYIVFIHGGIYLLEIWNLIWSYVMLSTIYSKTGRHNNNIHHVVKIVQIFWLL